MHLDRRQAGRFTTRCSIVLNDHISFEDALERYSKFFPSKDSLRWFLRKHRVQLEDSGAAILIAGRIFLHTERFDQAILDIGRDDFAGKIAPTEAVAPK
jgi:hypothetical protein